MADFTRDVEEVQPNNFIRQGVQKPSALATAASLAGQAIDLDVALAKEKLRKDAEDLRTTFEVSAPGSAAVQDAVALTPEDQRQLNSVATALKTNNAAVQQGRMSYDEYRIRGERMLRMAISKRPGLAQEMRAIASQHLGVDVVGASVDVLASWENKMLAAQQGKEDKRTEDFKRMRDQLDLVGVVNGHMTDEQVMATYAQNMGAVQEALKHKATNEVVTTEASTMEAGQKLRRPQATAAFVTEVQKNKLDIYRSFSQAWAAYQTGNKDFMTNLPQILTQGKADLSGRISNLRTAMAQGDVNPEIAEKEIAGLEAMGGMMEELASGKLSADVLKNKMEGTLLFMQNALMDNENVATLAAATKVFGPELMTQYVGPGGSFNKTGAIAVGDALNNTGSGLTRASNAGTVASSVIISTLDRGGAKSNPEMVTKMGETLINAGNSFVEVENKDFKADYLTGPTGYLTTLHAHREALSKALGEDQKKELMGSVAMAALSNYHTLAASIGRKYPSIARKLDFNLDPSTGEFVRAKAGVNLSPTEKAALRSYNRAFKGKEVLQLFQTLGGVDAPTARNLLFSGQPHFEEMKKRAKEKPAGPTDLTQAAMADPASMTGGGGPAVGTVEDGFRFKGGNPSDPLAWERVK